MSIACWRSCLARLKAPCPRRINGTRPDERRQTAALSVNGAGDIENNQMIDGADNNER
jgi:hypothetical protein